MRNFLFLGFNQWETGVYFGPLFVLFKTLLGALTYSAMMEKTPRKTAKGKTIYNCNVCGKEAENGDMKKHIEAKHLEGVAIPCNLCEKTFRSRNSLTTHNNRYHNVLTWWPLLTFHENYFRTSRALSWHGAKEHQ